MVQVWINETKPSENSAALIGKLEKLTAANAGKKFRSYVMFISDDGIKSDLEKIRDDQKVKNCGITYLNKGKKDGALRKYKIDPSAEFKNVVLVYVNKKVTARFQDLKVADFGKLEAAVGELVD